MKVRAKDTGEKYSGYYGHRRRKPGEVFELEPIKRLRKDNKTGLMREITITEEQQFSDRWMERIDGPAPAPKKEKKEPVAGEL
jgi:hypothetical protein